MATLRDRREAIVREHIESENEGDFDHAVDMFADAPRYELIGLDRPVLTTRDAVVEFHLELRTAFPDLRSRSVRDFHHTDRAVIVEFELQGTHQGPFLGFEPTGRTFRSFMVSFFMFNDDRLVGERIYFDLATVLSGLGLLAVPA